VLVYLYSVLCFRCFGFVVFENKECMDKALAPDKVDKHVIDGRNVNMKKAVPHAVHQVRRRFQSNDFMFQIWSIPFLFYFLFLVLMSEMLKFCTLCVVLCYMEPMHL